MVREGGKGQEGSVKGQEGQSSTIEMLHYLKPLLSLCLYLKALWCCACVVEHRSDTRPHCPVSVSLEVEREAPEHEV